MNKMKKFASIATAVLMTACMAAPMTMSLTASAAGSISINNSATDHTYVAYQIFDGDLSEGGVLSNITWGTGVKETDNLLADIKNITLSDSKNPFTSCTNAADVAKVLSDANAGNDAEITQKFASVVGKYLETTAGIESLYDNGVYSITNVDDGYYLVKDKDASLGGKDDAYTRYIVQVLGNKSAIAPKSAKPSVIKKVKENSSNTVSSTTVDFVGSSTYDVGEQYNDVADYNIGDSVPFKLYGSMPSNLGDYEHYYYKFIDTLGSQFTIDDDTKFTIKIDDIVVANKVGSGSTDNNYRIKVDGNNIEISFEDIKAYATENNAITASTVVTVEYTAKLNDTAEIGLPGQINAVKLTYSNNPNFEYKPDTSDETEDTPDKDTPDTPKNTGETPVDKVIVFTYELDATKVDKTDNSKVLPGAEFKMKKSDTEYAKVGATGIFEGWVTEAEASTLKSDIDGNFIVKGIDEGTYTLIETKAPAGYNLPTGKDAEFAVNLVATTVNGQSWNEFVPGEALTKLELNGEGQDNSKHGTANIKIENSKGSSLPSTGGIGTTLFYVGGGAMVAVAGVFLITKKRMGRKED